jgi:putative ABC transport system ATP-binding protein
MPHAASHAHPQSNRGLVVLTIEGLRRLHVSASFDVHSGECIALQGASGVGKSLLLRAIADLDLNEGILKLDGVLRESMPAPLWRKKVTYVAAEPGWWAETVQEHFPAWSEAIPLIEKLGLPVACGSWDIRRLSTGEKQRLGLVRALVLGSRVLLLDEPTSALDANSTKIVEAIIADRASMGAGIIWSTHDKAQAQRVGSRLFVMSGGRIEELPP